MTEPFKPCKARSRRDAADLVRSAALWDSMEVRLGQLSITGKLPMVFLSKLLRPDLRCHCMGEIKCNATGKL